VRAARAQRNHINCAIRAFLRLEQHRVVTGTSWWEARIDSSKIGSPALLMIEGPG